VNTKRNIRTLSTLFKTRMLSLLASVCFFAQHVDAATQPKNDYILEETPLPTQGLNLKNMQKIIRIYHGSSSSSGNPPLPIDKLASILPSIIQRLNSIISIPAESQQALRSIINIVNGSIPSPLTDSQKWHLMLESIKHPLLSYPSSTPCPSPIQAQESLHANQHIYYASSASHSISLRANSALFAMLIESLRTIPYPAPISCAGEVCLLLATVPKAQITLTYQSLCPSMPYTLNIRLSRTAPLGHHAHINDFFQFKKIAFSTCTQLAPRARESASMAKLALPSLNDFFQFKKIVFSTCTQLTPRTRDSASMAELALPSLSDFFQFKKIVFST